MPRFARRRVGSSDGWLDSRHGALPIDASAGNRRLNLIEQIRYSTQLVSRINDADFQ